MSIFFQPEIQEGSYFLSEEESRHCTKVLRLRSNDEITVVDGKGHYFQAMLIDTNPKRTTFKVINQLSQPPLPYSIHLYIAPTKNLDRMEWMVEKLTEIGINTIQFVECDHSERKVLKLDRLIRKGISAMKQSGRAYLPKINALKPLADTKNELLQISQKFIPHITEEQKTHLSQAIRPNEKNALLVGPEGGFSIKELEWATELNFQTVSLGNYRLRTETAGLVACQTIHTMSETFYVS